MTHSRHKGRIVSITPSKQETATMTTREKLERSNPTVDSPTYRRLTNQISEKEYKKALDDEKRRIDRPQRQVADGR